MATQQCNKSTASNTSSDAWVTHTNTDIKAAGLCLQLHICQGVCDSPALAQLDCYSLCVHVCIHTEAVYLHAVSYPLSGSHAGFVFLVSCRVLQDESRSFFQTFIRTVNCQAWHLIQDVLYRDTHTKAWGHQGANVYTHCVYQELFPWKHVTASVKSTSEPTRVWIILDSFSCNCIKEYLSELKPSMFVKKLSFSKHHYSLEQSFLRLLPWWIFNYILLLFPLGYIPLNFSVFFDTTKAKVVTIPSGSTGNSRVLVSSVMKAFCIHPHDIIDNLHLAFGVSTLPPAYVVSYSMTAPHG